LPKPTTAKLTLTVQLADGNEAPTITSPSLFKLKENNSAGVVVGTVKAVEIDKTAAFKTVTYSLVAQQDAAGNSVGLFTIDPAKGIVRVPIAGAINFEASPTYTLIVRATDGGGQFQDQVVTVQVVDVNEPLAITLLDATQTPVAGLSVAENTPAGALVGYLRLANPDAVRAETVKLTLTDSLGSAFQVGPYDPASGLATITVRNALKLNFEAIKGGAFKLNVTAVDSGFISSDGSRQGATTAKLTFTGFISDVNEAPASVTFKAARLPSGSAPLPAGALLGVASVVDTDKSPQSFTWSLPTDRPDNALFVVDAVTGQVRAAVSLARKATYSILLRVTDQGGLAFDKLLVIKT